MRLIVFALASVLAVPAAAIDLPVRSGAIYCFDAMEIDREGIFGPDHQCFAIAEPTIQGTVALLCEHGEIEYGPPWIEAVIIIEHPETDTLTYVDENGLTTAQRCHSQ